MAADGRPNPARSSQARSNQGQSNQARSDQARSSQARSNPARSSQARSNQARSNQGQSNQARSNQARSNEGRSNQGRGDQARRNAAPGKPAGEKRRRGSQARAGHPGKRSAARVPGERGHADPARRVAFEVLRSVAERDAYANLLLPALLRKQGLSGRDAALATELLYGALRGQGSYDAVLALCCDRDLDRVDPPLLYVLRLGTHQLLATRVGAHAAVATSVDLARDVAGSRLAGFVNAVLRRVATRDLESWLEIAAPPRKQDLAGHLSVRYSHPRWIVSALGDALGESVGSGLAETEAALAANNARPRVALCAVPELADPAELAVSGAEPAGWSPFGAYLAEGDPARIRAVAQGRATVQDEASQLAVLALVRAETASDGPWLDVCAGPGGKARLLAGLAVGRGARLLASDVREHRAQLLRAGLLRSGLSQAGSSQAGSSQAGSPHAGSPQAGSPQAGSPRPAMPPDASAAPGIAVVAADGTVPAWRRAAFSRVLADVPCSGLGALRRRAEARWRRSPGDVAALAPVQRGLLTAALDSAAPGGVVAYVTCSPHVAETRHVVTDVQAARDDVEVLDAPAMLLEVPGLRCPEPYSAFAQFWPHRHGTDAIFLALLRRAC